MGKHKWKETLSFHNGIYCQVPLSEVRSASTDWWQWFGRLGWFHYCMWFWNVGRWITLFQMSSFFDYDKVRGSVQKEKATTLSPYEGFQHIFTLFRNTFAPGQLPTFVSSMENTFYIYEFAYVKYGQFLIQ